MSRSFHHASNRPSNAMPALKEYRADAPQCCQIGPLAKPAQHATRTVGEAAEQGLPLGLVPPLEELMHHAHRGGVVGAEGERMQHLREQQQDDDIHRPADEHEAQHRRSRS